MTGMRVRRTNEKYWRMVAEENGLDLRAENSGKVCTIAWKKEIPAFKEVQNYVIQGRRV